MTKFRRALLWRAEGGASVLSLTTSERRQMNEMARFGWVEKAGQRYLITESGRRAKS